MIELIDKDVKHKKFGNGKVTDIEGNYIYISFEKMIKKFSFPEVFKEHLKLEDKVLAKKIQKLVKTKEKEVQSIESSKKKKWVTKPKSERVLYLVETYEDVVKNARVFSENLKDCVDVKKKLSSFQHWYYFEEIDKFAPSKFIGYQDISFEDYIYGTSRDYGYMDGRETELQLSNWFMRIPDERKDFYYHKLRRELSSYNKVPNKRTSIHIRKKL